MSQLWIPLSQNDRPGKGARRKRLPGRLGKLGSADRGRSTGVEF
jgi:hypothetical protein